MTDPNEYDEDDPRPRNLDAERAVLGAMMLNGDVVGEVQRLVSADDFHTSAHATIFTRIVGLFEGGQPVDPIAVSTALARANELQRVGGAPYLHTLISDVPTASNAGYYAELVAEAAARARLVDTAVYIRQLATSGNSDSVVEQAREAFERATASRDAAADTGAWVGDVIDDHVASWDDDDPQAGIEWPYLDVQDLTNGLKPGQLVVVAGRPGVGKALALDTPLPTPTGWTTMGEVRVGDQLLDRRGRPTVVIGATDVMRGRPCYEVEFSDGTVITADASHQWFTETRASRRSKVAGGAIRTTEEIAATLRTETADRRVNHSVSTCEPLDLPEADLPLPPYALGIWLGDGSTHTSHYTSADPEVAAHLQVDGLNVELVGGLRYAMRLPLPPPIQPRRCVVCDKEFVPATSEVRSCGRRCGGRAAIVSPAVPPPSCPECGGTSSGRGMCRSCYLTKATVTGVLRGLGVLDDKHVPPQYLRASESQRRALLAGLLDSDGTVTPSGSVQFSVTSERLARDVAELVATLGLRCSTTTKRVAGRRPDSSVAYTVTFTTARRVFRLERKHLVHKQRRRSESDARRSCRYIVDVRPVPSVPVRCVEVANDEHLYLASKALVPTHNSTVAMDMARHAACGKASVMFASLEMTRDELLMRLACAEAGVRFSEVRRGRRGTLSWNERCRVREAQERIKDMPLRIEDQFDMTLGQIRAAARKMARSQRGLDMLVVDHIGLVTPADTRVNRQEQVAGFSRGLKNLAKELAIPVIEVAQLNRGPEQRIDKKPQLSDLRESGALEQDADMVVLVYRPDAFEYDNPRAGEADLIVAKHRGGPTATITVAHQLHYCRFADLARGTDYYANQGDVA